MLSYKSPSTLKAPNSEFEIENTYLHSKTTNPQAKVSNKVSELTLKTSLVRTDDKY
jgi:hypothetical protein